MSRKADRLFPYLKEPCKDKLPQNERRDIFQNVKAMLMHKIGNVVVNNTDNLLISSFVGGCYSRYLFQLFSDHRICASGIGSGYAGGYGKCGKSWRDRR